MLTKHNILDINEVLDEEKFELGFPSLYLSKPLCIIPWRSLNQAGQLQTVFSIPEKLRFATILKWEWTISPIIETIRSAGFKVLFSTSTYPNADFINFAYPDYSRNDINPSLKDIKVTFIGWNNNEIRKRILDLYSNNPYIIGRKRFHVEAIDSIKSVSYSSILNRARFCICPKGVTSGTKRFWEALRAGAIPILISDNLRLPNCWDWDNTIIRLKESSVLQKDSKIENSMIISPERENLLRNNCLKANLYFNDPKSVIQYVDNTLRNI